MSKFLAFCESESCKECGSTLMQRIDLTSEGNADYQPPHWKLKGVPYCNDCHPTSDDDELAIGVPTWELLPIHDRKRIVRAILYELEENGPIDTPEDSIAKLIDKAWTKACDARLKGIKKIMNRLVKEPALLEDMEAGQVIESDSHVSYIESKAPKDNASTALSATAEKS